MDTVFEIQSLETFTKVSEDLVTNLYSSKSKSCQNIDINILQEAKESLKRIIYNSDYDFNKIREIFQSKGWNEDRVNWFLTYFEKKKVDILYSALLNRYSENGETIKDFDWFVKLIVGTNDLITMKYPVLELVLITVNSKGEEKRRVYDISRNVLKKLITLLENYIENGQ